MTEGEAAEMLCEWKDMDNRMAVVLKETDELIGSASLLERLGFTLQKSVDWAYKKDADGNPIPVRARVCRLTD